MMKPASVLPMPVANSPNAPAMHVCESVPNKHLAGPHVPFLGQGRVADTPAKVAGVLPLELTPGGVELPRALGIVDHVVEVTQALFAHECAQDVHVAVGHAVGRENVMVRDDDDLVPVPDLRIRAEFAVEHADGPRPANVVREQDVGVDPNVVAGLDAGPSAGAGENGFGEGHGDEGHSL